MKALSVLAVFTAYNALRTTRSTFVYASKVDRVESPAVASHPLRLLKTMPDETAGAQEIWRQSRAYTPTR